MTKTKGIEIITKFHKIFFVFLKKRDLTSIIESVKLKKLFKMSIEVKQLSVEEVQRFLRQINLTISRREMVQDYHLKRMINGESCSQLQHQVDNKKLKWIIL